MVTTLFAAFDQFETVLPAGTPLTRRAATTARRHLLACFPGFRELWRLYGSSRNSRLSSRSFETSALDALGITFQVETGASDEIPENGPLIVAANHPTGIADGLVMIEAIRRTRQDVRVVTNSLLACFPELRDTCFFIDPFGGRMAARRSLGGLRAAHRWLQRGGCVLLFPAGEVASRGWMNAIRKSETPAESGWHPTLGRLAMATRAQVVPAFVAGRNSMLFYAAGTLHPALRTFLLGHELLRHQGTTFTIRFGPTIVYDRLQAQSAPEKATRLVRGELESLSTRVTNRDPRPIAPSRHRDLRSREIASLPRDAKLLTSGAFDVFCADSTHIPNVLDEIGRLREVTFRRAGEGTGLERDVDRFDAYYQHLFVWDRTRSQIVGAYRVGATDRVLSASGLEGLYTSTLFRYDEHLMDRIGPALELGRSFVQPEYQRSHSALLLLWKGIGALIAGSPRYRMLFGAVSISSRYRAASQRLLRSFLSQHHRSDLASLVHGLNPPPSNARPARDTEVLSDIEELNASIRSIEGDHGIPVLLRHYLRLDAKLLGFNVDRSFGNALDALMIVDLMALTPATLGKYLGRDGAESFLEYQAGRHSTPQRAA